MANQNELYDLQQFLQQQSTLRDSTSPSTTNASTISWDDRMLDTPLTSPTVSARGQSGIGTSSISSIGISAPLTLSFTKGSKLFKLRYSQIEIHRDGLGSVQSIELNDLTSASGSFIQTFPNSKRPIPHLEQPATSTKASLCVFFLDDSLVQLANTVFNTRPRYTFDNVSDCYKFQEGMLGNVLLFVAGVAEVTSKGRGEEAISQNLRVCRTKGGRDHLLFFSNAQRKDRKLYMTVPVDDIEEFEQPRKETKPIQLKLRSSSTGRPGSASLVSLSILFIDSVDARRFCQILRSLNIKSS